MDALKPSEAMQFWDHFEPRIRQALNRLGNVSNKFLMQIHSAVKLGEAQILLGEEGFAVVYMDAKVMNLVVYHGSIRELRMLAPAFYLYARSLGADTIRIIGPRAWLRVFPKMQEKLILMEASLVD
jgi:hypothetical protein